MNNVENKNDLNKMSDLEFGKNKVEMMRYRENSLSYKLGMGGVAFSVLACFFCLNAFNPINFTTILAIMLNVVILLGGFLSVEKAKSYSYKGSIGLIVFGGICIARIFWIPLLLIVHYNGWIADKDALSGAQDEFNSLKDALESAITTYGEESSQAEAAAAALADQTTIVNNINSSIENHTKYIGRTITTNNYNKLTYLPTDGNVRAALAIVCLVVAAAFFISAGYIGMVRSKKLNTYLNSINQKKVGGN